MTTEKRILLAFALSFLLMMGWRSLYPPPEPDPETQTPDGPAVAEVEMDAPAEKTASTPHVGTLPLLRGSQAQEIIIESDLYRVTFSTKGAVVKSWVLKEYKDSRKELLREPLDVVNGAASKGAGYPFSLSLEGSDLTQKVNEAVYLVNSGPNRRVAPTELIFEFSDGQVQVRKTFAFDSSYVVHVDTQVNDGRRNLPHKIHWYGGFGDHEVPASEAERYSQVIYGLSGEPEFTDQDDIDGEQSIAGPLELAGLADRYFAAIFFPGSTNSSFQVSKRSWEPPDWTDGDKPTVVDMALSRTDIQFKPIRLFVGPKDLTILRDISPSLEALIDFGCFLRCATHTIMWLATTVGRLCW